MKTAVRETSINTYRQIEAEGIINERQRQVLAVMKKGRDYSLQELVKLTGLPINVISGRVNELKSEKLHRLEHGPKRECSITHRTIHPVRLAELQHSLLAMMDE